MKRARCQEGFTPPGVARAALSWRGAVPGCVEGSRIGVGATVGKAEGQLPILLLYVGGNRPGAEENDEEDRRRHHDKKRGWDRKTLNSGLHVLHDQETRRMAGQTAPARAGRWTG